MIAFNNNKKLNKCRLAIKPENAPIYAGAFS